VQRLSKAAILTLLLCLFVRPLVAHEVLGPVRVNEILKSIQKSRAALAGTPSPQDRSEALFNIGVDAYALMKLINQELQEHGAEANLALINLAVTRCGEMGVNIKSIANGDHYMYDFAAFSEYLKVAPSGEHVPEVRFALIEKNFYEMRGASMTPAARSKQIEEKRQLLREYPKLSRRADLRMFLVFDYLDLYGYYEERQDPAKAEENRKQALDLCRAILAEDPESGAANFARDVLIKFGL